MILNFRSKTFRAGLVLGVFSFIADIAGLLRDRVLASHFGASRTLDIYYSAFKIPDLIFNLLILGAISSAFIPVFIENYRKDQLTAWRVAQNFISVGFFAVIIAVGAMLIFIRPLVSLIAPGFQGSDRETTITLTRLMLLSPIIFSLSSIVGSILQSLERFISYAIAPILYNIGIILGAVYLAPVFKSHGRLEVLGLGLGVILGALLHLVVQLPSAVRAGFRFKVVLSFADQNLRKILRLMVPRTVGLGAYGIESMVTNAIASTMSAGSIAVFNFANNLQFVPIAVVGVSMATAVFPRLSLHASGNERSEFKSKLNETLKNTFYIVAPIALLVFVLRGFIIKTVFGIGLFRSDNIEITASVLGIFMTGVIAQSLIPILSRAFYAFQNTRTPVIISLIAIGLNVLLAITFSFGLGWGIRGLAVAFSIAGNVNFLLLYLFFRRFWIKLGA